MPNGRRRQSNTAHANRQRNLHRDLTVVDSIPVSIAPVVVEAIELSESRSGEVKKLKGQIIGLRNKISNMEKQMDKLSEIKEEKQELSKTLNQSIKLCEDIKEDRDRFEDELDKLSGLKEQNRDLAALLKSALDKACGLNKTAKGWRDEIHKSNKFLAHISNELLGTKHDPDAPFNKLHKDLTGTDYDGLIQFIKESHRLLSYFNIVMKTSRENKEKQMYFCDGDDMYIMIYHGKKKDVTAQCVEVKIPTTGDNQKDYEETIKRDAVAQKLLETKKITHSALKNYSW